MKDTLTPLKLTDRIESLDVMRGLVLFGILLMNALAGYGLNYLDNILDD